jgi:hypothetical protein
VTIEQRGRTYFTKYVNKKTNAPLSAQKSEEKRLLEAAGPHLHALITAGLETGCRVGELLSRADAFLHDVEQQDQVSRVADAEQEQQCRCLNDCGRCQASNDEPAPLLPALTTATALQ